MNDPFDEKYTDGSTCYYCDIPTKQVGSFGINGQPHRDVFYCGECGAYVGTHQYELISKGSVANPRVRSLRMQVHKCFDPVWEEALAKYPHLRKQYIRNTAYQLLAEFMDIHRDNAHIGYFQEAECKKALAIDWKLFGEFLFLSLNI